MNKDKVDISVFLKGFLMGICDIIPGISGGTIAFITGIYIRLISGIKNLTISNLLELLSLIYKQDFVKFKKKFVELDIIFLIVLFLGIFTAIFSVSSLVKFLLEIYPAFTLTFFLGLILASSKLIFNEIENHKKQDILFAVIGFFIGFLMVFLSPKEILTPSLLYVLFGGFMAVSALFLPGISGSFILLVMGLYEFILNTIHNIQDEWKYLLFFSIGTILGAFFISRIITFCYSKDKSKTLYLLFGLVLGSLFVLVDKIYVNVAVFDFLTIDFLAIFLLFGVLVVVLINMLSRDK